MIKHLAHISSFRILLRVTLLVLLFCNYYSVYAQPLLKLDDAIAIGLKNNYEIQFARNEADINKINNSASNAGMNPNLSLNMGANFAFNNTHLEYSTGSIIDNPNAANRNYSAGLIMNWTIFDGFKMFTTKRKLEEIESLGESKFKSQVQQTIYQIVAAYYDIVKQVRIYQNIVEVKALSAERMKLGETRFNAGLSAKNELLQAQIDFNTQSQNEILQISLIEFSKRKLFDILNQPFNNEFAVEEAIPVNKIDSINVLARILEKNPTLTILKNQIKIAKLATKEFDAYYLPFISLTAGYGFNQTENTTGQVINNRGFGPSFGLSLSYPIYQGGNISRQIQTSELAVLSVELQYNALQNQITTQFQNSLNQYITYSKLFEIENQTKDLAKENLYLAMERLKLSQTTSIEVRDAQVSYENSLSRLNNIYYNLKISETQIKLLAGEL